MQCCSKRVSLKLTAHLRGQEPSRGQGRLWIVMRPPRLRWRWKLTPNQHSGWAAQPPSGCAAAHEECTMGVILVGKNSGLSEENLRISLAVRQRCPPPPTRVERYGQFSPSAPLTGSWFKQWSPWGITAEHQYQRQPSGSYPIISLSSCCRPRFSTVFKTDTVFFLRIASAGSTTVPSKIRKIRH